MHDAPLEKSVHLWAFLWASLSCCSSSTRLPKKPEGWSCSGNSGFQSAISFAWNSPSHSTAGPCSSFRAHLCSEACLLSLSVPSAPGCFACTLPKPFFPGEWCIIFPWGKISLFPLSDHRAGMGLIPPFDSRLSTRPGQSQSLLVTLE